MTQSGKLLLQEFRGSLVECEYFGHICGVGTGGDIRYTVGDPNFVMYMRSAAKPFQAIPGILAGVEEHFQFTDAEIALMVGSHRAESFHVEAAESMASKLGVSEEALVCPPSWPLNADARVQAAKEGHTKRRIYHNCSGKHLGLMACCKAAGLPIEGYEQLDHPVQQRILGVLSAMSDVPKEDIQTAIDGCGLPVFALPLSGMARAFLKLAVPESIADPKLRGAVERMDEAIHAFPEMVAGTGLICTQLMKDDNIIAKGGAKGVYCFALRKERLAFALKVIDGSEEKWAGIVASILEQIGYGNQDTIARMYDICPKVFANGNGTPVGRNTAAFQLESVQ